MNTPIPEEDRGWLSAVGLIAVRWAQCEMLIDSFIRGLVASNLGSNTHTQPIDMAFSKRIRLWKDTVEALPLDPSLKAVSHALADKARNARNDRDLLVHGYTYKRASGKYMAMHFPKHPGIPQPREYSEQDALDLAAEILSLTSALLEHMEKVHGPSYVALLEKLDEGIPVPDIRQIGSTPHKP